MNVWLLNDAAILPPNLSLWPHVKGAKVCTNLSVYAQFLDKTYPSFAVKQQKLQSAITLDPVCVGFAPKKAADFPKNMLTFKVVSVASEAAVSGLFDVLVDLLVYLELHVKNESNNNKL